MCGLRGSNFLYARRQVQRLLEPLVVNWGWEPPLTPALSQGERERRPPFRVCPAFAINRALDVVTVRCYCSV